MKTKILILGLFITSLSYSQSNNAENILEQIKKKLSLVNDYSSEVEVSVKMDFLKMPNSKAELFFKKPDKFKFQSESFAILPKAGFEFNPQKILDNDYTATIIGDTVVENEILKIIKIIPNADSLKFQSANILINEKKILISELILETGNNSFVVTKFKYDNYANYGLPSELKVSLDFSETDENDKSSKRKSRIPSNFKGNIIIKYSDYKVNEGIEDSFFEEQEEEENPTKIKNTNK